MRVYTSSWVRLSFIFLLGFYFSCQQGPSDLSLSPIFSDHMVLQQAEQVPIWGTAAPYTNVTVDGSWGNSVSARTNSQGQWDTDILMPAAGGPFEVTISTNDTAIIIKDVMAGEVWLCSGQSNMEMPLEGWLPTDPILNADEEIANANYPMIRMFTMQKAIEVAPTTEYAGSWEVCNSANAGDFSATAYFFGRTLHQKLNVPIGLIHTSWGGTPAEAWTEGNHLTSITDYLNVLQELEQAKPQQLALNNWLSNKEIIAPTILPEETQWQNLDFKDEGLITGQIIENKLTNINMPMMWEQEEIGLDAFDGTILFRKEVVIPNAFLNQELTLELGAIDDMDETYFNGIKVGAMMGTGKWNTKRVYTIPKELTSKNKNLIAIRVVDTGGGGGFSSGKESMRLYIKGRNESVNLGGDGWNYLPIAEYGKGKFYLYGGTIADFEDRPKVDIAFNAHSPTVLYNAMIAPLVPYYIKGVIWYQGESNAERAKQYETLFPKMIESWRTAWNDRPFPFYFTQIAPYNYGNGNGIASAQLRDAQRKALAVPNTGMAVTLDIGNSDNIHPANKQDVGKRLALWALAKDYHQSDILFSGPLYKGMTIEENKIRVAFQFADGLKTEKRTVPGVEIAGADNQFLPAIAIIEGKELVAHHPQIESPLHVRYAFKNSSAATLFNGAGLPASSFTTEE